MRGMIPLLMIVIAVLRLSPALGASFDAFKVTGIDQRPGAAIPRDDPFIDENDHAVTLRQLGAGKPMLLVPVLHHCPNICGVTLSGLMEAIGGQKFRAPDDFAIITFGIDPTEGPKEAQQSLRDLRLRFPRLAANGIHALTGRADEIRRVTDALGYRYAWDPDIGQYAHDAAVAILTPDGHLSRWLYGLAPDPTDLRLALTQAGNGQTGALGDQILLLCYHYDPITGRYSPLINLALPIGAAATVALGGGAIALSVLREKRRAKTLPDGRR
jgi:protein SCO1